MRPAFKAAPSGRLKLESLQTHASLSRFISFLSKRAFVSNFYNRPEGEGVRATFAKVANQLPSRDNRRLRSLPATNVFFFSFVMAGR